jgi:hypothetical protein
VKYLAGIWATLELIAALEGAIDDMLLSGLIVAIVFGVALTWGGR